MVTDFCPICSLQDIEKHVATIAPFLRVRCKIEEINTLSCFCNNCSFVFFERRLSPSESGALYNEYRSDEYTNQRLDVEPTYAQYLELFSNPFSDYWRVRTNELLEVLRENHLMDSKEVLDFGGDGTIPSRILPASIVDVDDPAHRGGKTKLESYELIFASEVFEHLTDPKSNLLNLSKLLRNGGKILIDIPLEYEGSIRQEWDLQRASPGSFMNMHEHINHFSVEAMYRLAEVCSMRVDYYKITKNNFLVFLLSQG